jgi:BolA family transcriptional regulator, general stress-responsive regulator
MTAERVAAIDQRLRAAFAPEALEVQDDSAAHAGHAGARSGKGHFNVLIVAEAFAGKPLLERHRMVYEALGELMHTDIHALSVKALAPDEL